MSRSRTRCTALSVVALIALAGCTAAPAETTRPQSEPTAERPAPAAGFTWSEDSSGFDGDVLNRLAADARRQQSTCFLVSRGDAIAEEDYFGDGAVDEQREVFSVTKSITSTLIGLAVKDGLLDLDDRASRFIPAWRGTDAADVTLRNLLSGDSGRLWTRQADYAGLIAADDRTAYAVGLGQQHAPGEVWTYNNAAIQTLDAVLREATGGATAAYAQRALFDKLGMADTRMTGDGSGNSTSMSFGTQSTCRDLARLGLLMARDGVWEGERLLPRGWVEQATTPSTELNTGYGLLWWLNRPGTLRGPFTDPEGPAGFGQRAPGAPERIFAAEGFGGQVVLVDPRTDTVVVRIGGISDYSLDDAARVLTEAGAG